MSETPKTTEEAKPSSLKSLLAMAGSRKCTFSDTEASGQSQGTVFATTGKMRSDFSTVANGQTMKSHTIVDGQTSYVWVDGQTTGFKMDFESTPAQSGNPQARTVDPNKNISFSCSVWQIDNSLFAVPANIQFSDTTSVMLQKTPSGQISNSTIMAACERLAEPDKSKCLEALKNR